MKKLIALLLCFCLHTNVYGMGSVPEPTPTPTPTPVVTKVPDPIHINTGMTITFKTDGWFFTEAAEKKIRFRLIDADYFEKQLQLTQMQVEQYKSLYQSEQLMSDKYHKAWLESDETLTKVLKQESRTKFWYFLGGVLLTIGAGVAIGYAAKAVK